jgi:PAS domain S-box-containing protein
MRPPAEDGNSRVIDIARPVESFLCAPTPAALAERSADARRSVLATAEQEYARLDALLEAVPLAVAVFDGALLLAATNARYRDLTGVDVTQAVGRSVYDAFPNALADLTEQVDIARGGVPSSSVRVPFQHRGGRRLVEATFSPLLDARGGRGLLFAGNDITEREGLREDLARSVAQLESIFDVLPTRCAWWTPRAARCARTRRRSRSTARGTRRRCASSGSSTVPVRSAARHCSCTSTRRRARCAASAYAARPSKCGAAGETAVIEVNSNPLYDPHKRVRGAVTVERDVTERTRLQQQCRRKRSASSAWCRSRTKELTALQEAAARDRRLAAVGQLAAGVMHDVNNALNPIMAAAYLLEMNAENPAAVRDYAVRIARAAENGRRDRRARRTVHPPGAAARHTGRRRRSLGDGRGGGGHDAPPLAGAREGRRDQARGEPRRRRHGARHRR